MDDEQTLPLREYVGVIWIDEQPGVRLRVAASSAQEARSLVVAQYGEGHVISVWNEDDADAPRAAPQVSVDRESYPGPPTP